MRSARTRPAVAAAGLDSPSTPTDPAMGAGPATERARASEDRKAFVRSGGGSVGASGSAMTPKHLTAGRAIRPAPRGPVRLRLRAPEGGPQERRVEVERLQADE